MQNLQTYTPDPEMHVGDIVANNYNAADIFRQYGLDFCCGGGISLKEACEKNNINLDSVMAQLQSLNSSRFSESDNYLAWEPGFLIDHIVNTHHRFVHHKTREIQVYAAKVAAVHGERNPKNIEIFEKFQALSEELLTHLEAEEERVFPLIQKIYQTRMEGRPVSEKLAEELRIEIELMEKDHDGAGDIMKEIRELSNQYTPPADACATYRILYQNLEGFEQDLHKHVHLENNILFKKAEKLIY